MNKANIIILMLSLLVPQLFSFGICHAEGITHLEQATRIDRHSLVSRNNPVVNSMDTLSSLSVGNGELAYTVDATGLQSFPEYYAGGICLGTQSQWGWHSFPNTEGYKFSEVLKPYDFGHHSKRELYACQFREKGRQHDASEYFRINPHRLHLGIIGFDFDAVRQGTSPSDIKDIYQHLDLWQGVIASHFSLDGQRYTVHTTCSPERDMIAAHVVYKPSFAGVMKPHAPVVLRLPYPTGGHVDGACSWDKDERHSSAIVNAGKGYGVVRHTLDSTTYYIIIRWTGDATLSKTSSHRYTLKTDGDVLDFSVEFLQEQPSEGSLADSSGSCSYASVSEASRRSWHDFWTSGAAVDFSHCTDPRSKELERRVVLSQYLLAIQSAGSMPPQETGLTMNSWFGKFHLEMIWWHQSHFPLWGHPELLNRTLNWYHRAEPVARQIAERQGFDGIRWMKMTDPDAMEAPSKVGSFLIWQQPHLIHLAELVYRATKDEAVLKNYYDLVMKTAEFMYSFATYDEANDRYILKGIIAAQETLRASENVNPPMELSSWHYGLSTAQLWRERMGEPRVAEWDTLLAKLSPLAKDAEGKLYLASEDATDSYTNIRFISDHPAVTGALGMYPESRLLDKEIMNNTID